MSSSPLPNLNPTTPLRAGRMRSSVTPGSANRTRCSDDPADFTLVKIHTAKCSICDKRNTTDEMRRCKGCTWQICRPCQLERQQNGRSLAHGNLLTGTPGGSTVRRQKLFPLSSLARVKDADVEAALAKIKAEERVELKTNKAAANQTDEVITPPSSGERKNPGRKTKVYTSYAELEEDLEEEEAEVRHAQSPVSTKLGKRKFPETSPVVHKLFEAKRARMEQPAHMQAATPLLKPKPSGQDNLPTGYNTFSGFDQGRDIGQSKHSKIMETMFGNQKLGQSVLAPNLYNYTPAPESPPTKFSSSPPKFPSSPPKFSSSPSLFARNGGQVPRKSGEEFMESVRPQVRKNLNERFGWQLEDPGATPTPSTEQQLPRTTAVEYTLRKLVDDESSNLHHNLVLDQDQQAELLSVMMGAARKFGNEKYNAMVPAFKALAKPGLDFAIAHLNDSDKLVVVAAIQRQAAKKLQEFEEEIGSLSTGRR